jgi:hypothetical protein
MTIVTGIYAGGIYFSAGNKNYTERNNWRAIAGLLYFITITSLMHALSPTTIVFPM